MKLWIIGVMSQYGYLGISLLIAIENIFPPIPSEIILTFGGFMTTYSGLNVYLVTLFATVGSVVGAIVLYYVGRLLSPKRLERLIDKWGRILRLKMQDIQKAEDWFNKKGGLTVFFCRFIPIIRSLISIPAGMAQMPMGKFLVYTTVGTAIWNLVLVTLGAIAGENWGAIVNYVSTYSDVALAVFIVIAIGLAFWLFRRHKAKA